MNLTTRQVADRLGVSNASVRKLAENGKFKRIKTGNGKQRVIHVYPKSSVIEYENSLKSPRVYSEPKIKTFKMTTAIASENPSNRLERIEAKIDKLIKMWS